MPPSHPRSPPPPICWCATSWAWEGPAGPCWPPCIRSSRPGSVWMGGHRVTGKGSQARARQRAVLPQDTAVAFDFTVQEVVEMGRFPHRQQPSRHEARIVTEAMQATGVAHLAGRSINTLSGGERARSHLARALAQIWEPLPDGATRWPLLDEPTAPLAPGRAGPRSVHATAHLLTPATIAQVWGVHSTPVLAADGVPQYLVAAQRMAFLWQ